MILPWNPLLIIFLILPFWGCHQTAQKHAGSVNNSNTQNLTVGTVQKEIRIGMSGAEVASVLGSPNIVTTDENRQESWVYDRISTTEVYSRSSEFGFTHLLLIGAQSAAGARSKTQKTFTVVIKFNSMGQVRDFAYHSSQF